MFYFEKLSRLLYAVFGDFRGQLDLLCSIKNRPATYSLHEAEQRVASGMLPKCTAAPLQKHCLEQLKSAPATTVQPECSRAQVELRNMNNHKILWTLSSLKWVQDGSLLKKNNKELLPDVNILNAKKAKSAWQSSQCVCAEG